MRITTSATRHDLTARDANMRLQIALQAMPNGIHRLVNIKSCTDGAFGVVVMRHRRAEHRHHVIADMLVYAPAVCFDNPIYRLEVAIQQAVASFRT